MREILKKVYYCDHCSRKALTKHTIVKHESVCFHNEENKPACFKSCQHLEEKQYTDLAFETSHKGFWCNKFNKQVHTKGAVVYGLLDRFPNDFADSSLMPIECEGYESMYEYFSPDTTPF